MLPYQSQYIQHMVLLFAYSFTLAKFTSLITGSMHHLYGSYFFFCYFKYLTQNLIRKFSVLAGCVLETTLRKVNLPAFKNLIIILKILHSIDA